MNQLQNAWQLNDAAWEAIREETINAFPKDTNIILIWKPLQGNHWKLSSTKKSPYNRIYWWLEIKTDPKAKVFWPKILFVNQRKCSFPTQKSIKNLSNILVPVDFSENAARALKQAVTLPKG